MSRTGFPTLVLRTFMKAFECICKGKEIMASGIVGVKVEEAIEDQKIMEVHLLLQGLLSKKWRQAMGNFTTKRIASKNAQLAKVLWRNLCFPVLNQHNEFLHAGSSYVATKENEVLEETTLRMVKSKHRELIHYTQY